MPEDARITDFTGDESGDGEVAESAPDAADGEPDGSGDATDGAAPPDSERTAGADTDAAVALPEPTVGFVVDPVTCPSCGRATRRLWRDGDERVCGSCKTW